MAKRNRTSRQRTDSAEYSVAARPVKHGRQTLWVFIASAVVSAALCVLSISMSLMAAHFMQPMQQLGVPNSQLLGMWFLASAGWLMTAATIIVYWIALTRKGDKKRIRWAIAAVCTAAVFPASWILFYI
ncbi:MULTISPECIES: hypothetical protein [unclassified Brevibacterium]|uniref:hypothetical protein n=1 Tax=unclassified Brevibacterium TaxID=2614124 RepID=UPI0008A306B0|nr:MULTISPECIES: hypothetical protein [unclassified Brevibacterium]OFL67233.1 hypothetical protein HMPREF2757_11055 [Brevibacterium sp. HMSC063G07]OFS26713.1 hypothetical protein HMPREF3162_04630 [Brevibacterium sp. HMSC07C04]